MIESLTRTSRLAQNDRLLVSCFFRHNVLQSFGWNRQQHETKTSDSDDCTVRSIVVVMKIRVSVSSLSKVQLRHPWQESVFVICKNAYTLFAHPVLCSDFTPRALKKFTVCVITALHWILPLPGNWCRRARPF